MGCNGAIISVVEFLNAESKKYHQEAVEAYNANKRKEMLTAIHYSEAFNSAETKVRLIAELNGVDLPKPNDPTS